jgi:hypothetical protein
MKVASTIGFLFGTHNIANGSVTIDPCSDFARKRYPADGLNRRNEPATKFVFQDVGHNLDWLAGEMMFKIPKQQYTAEFKDLWP